MSQELAGDRCTKQPADHTNVTCRLPMMSLDFPLHCSVTFRGLLALTSKTSANNEGGRDSKEVKRS